MQPIMKSESGNGSKGLVWDRKLRAIERNKRSDRNGTMPTIRAEQNGMFEVKCSKGLVGDRGSRQIEKNEQNEHLDWSGTMDAIREEQSGVFGMKCLKGLVKDRGSRWIEGTKRLDRSRTMDAI